MVQQKLTNYIYLIFIGLIVVACNGSSNNSSGNQTPIVQPKKTVVYSPISSKLLQVSKEATSAQQKLAQVQISRSEPSPLPLNETNLPSELTRLTTFVWVGPAEESANKLAKLIDYNFHLVGNPPSIKPVVNLNFVNAPAVKILEQIGLQSYPIGEVTVDPNIKRVEYRYLNSHANSNLE